MKLQWSAKESAAENVKAAMPEMVRDFIVRGRQAAQAEEASQMHPFRLAAKQFRYTLEFLRPLYGKELDEYIHSVKTLQDRLGKVNDAVTTLDLIKDDSSSEGEKFRAHLHRRMAKDAEAFRAFWREQFDSSEVEERWVRFVRSPKKG